MFTILYFLISIWAMYQHFDEKFDGFAKRWRTILSAAGITFGIFVASLGMMEDVSKIQEVKVCEEYKTVNGKDWCQYKTIRQSAVVLDGNVDAD